MTKTQFYKGTAKWFARVHPEQRFFVSDFVFSSLRLEKKF